MMNIKKTDFPPYYRPRHTVKKKTKSVIGEYLLFIDYYVAIKEWVTHTKHITAHKKEVENKLEYVWVKREEVKKFEIYQNIDYENMRKEIQEMIKDVFGKDVVARDIKYYLIPLDKKYILKQIESNTKKKVNAS